MWHYQPFCEGFYNLELCTVSDTTIWRAMVISKWGNSGPWEWTGVLLLTLMEMRFYPDFLTTSASTHVQSEPSVLCNRLKALICGKQLWFLHWLTPRSAAGTQHRSGMKRTRDQWKAVAHPEANVQHRDIINIVLTGFNKWLEEPQTNQSWVLNAFHLSYTAAEIAA